MKSINRALPVDWLKRTETRDALRSSQPEKEESQFEILTFLHEGQEVSRGQGRGSVDSVVVTFRRHIELLAVGMLRQATLMLTNYVE